jgi:AcrR family transcriptional regulator
VGQGTLYRHFPTREHLVATILEGRVLFLEQRANELLNAADPAAALAEWLRLYDSIGASYRGMSAKVSSELAPEDSPLAHACAPMKAAFDELFARAHRAEVVRPDLTPTLLLALVGSLPKDTESNTTMRPGLELVLAGLGAAWR